MLLLLMKALWQFDTKEFSQGDSLLANNLEKFFAMLCMRLMGLKSVTLASYDFFGRRTMFAELSLSKPWEFRANRVCKVAMLSSFMIS